MLSCVLLLSACASPSPITPGSTRTSLLKEYVEQWDIKVPEDLVGLTAGTDLFRIPPGEISEATLSRRNLPRAREIISSGLTQSLSLRRLGDRYWLLAEIPPSSLWPLLKQYWERQEAGIAAEDALAGVLESAEVSEDDEKVSYRMLVEAGLRSSSTELHLERLGGREDPGKLQQRYRSILDYLSDTSGLTSSLLVQHLDFKPKMSTGTDLDGYPYMLLRIGRDRAWALLLKAVANLDWPRLGADSSRGIIEVEFRETILHEGWLDRWQDSPQGMQIGLTVPLPPPSTAAKVVHGARLGGAAKTDNSQVHLLLLESPEGIRVRVASGDLSFTASVEMISQLVQAVE